MVDLSEVMTTLKTLGIKVPCDQVEALIAQLDADEDAKVTYEELFALLYGTQ